MKYLLVLVLTFSINLVNAQFKYVCTGCCTKIDSIKAIDKAYFDFANYIKYKQDSFFILLDLLDIIISVDSNDEILNMLETIQKHTTLIDLEFVIKKIIDNKNFKINSSKLNLDKLRNKNIYKCLRCNSSSPKENHINSTRKLLEIRKYIIRLIEQRLSNKNPYIAYTSKSSKILKGVTFSLDNDSFSRENYDRDYTGGGRISIETDLFKFRVRPLRLVRDKYWKTFFAPRYYTGYQTIFYGAEAYTPYIKNTVIFNNSFSIDTLDRPFASFQYFGWSKYRLHYSNKFKTYNELKIGIIGGKATNIVQSLIHRDLIVSSVKPNGWDSQIAAGGRIGFNYLGKFDVRLFSKKSCAGYYLTPTLSTYGKLSLGNFISFSEIGLTIASFDFSGNGKYTNISNSGFRFYGKIEYGYRYVFHDSSLEGYGFLKQQPDEATDSPIDEHKLSYNQVKHNYGVFSFSLGYSTEVFEIAYSINRTGQKLDSSLFNIEKHINDHHYYGRITLRYRLIDR